MKSFQFSLRSMFLWTAMFTAGLSVGTFWKSAPNWSAYYISGYADGLAVRQTETDGCRQVIQWQQGEILRLKRLAGEPEAYQGISLVEFNDRTQGR